LSVEGNFVMVTGGFGSEDADMSNNKECEIHSRRKSKDSHSMIIRMGLVGT